ncbi:hypothetical protein H6P81_005123 [Aristolochia fimbriata]|uniref:BP28 C-terminal domain-containing protein n=1 Tax=Aristolochia fimbriata TaxID=158543 RepID=A0AAV7EU94_ARIFI|nr:hypothetical protein H6P81_005123 [Aristolochia fimbriata]
MATTLSAQLQAIKSFVQGETEPLKRPFTRPSVLFEPKEAADIDVETILSIGVAGLESLAGLNSRFSQFKETLFSRKSCETDRETMGIEENAKLDISISAYLRLLSGYLHVPSALKTLEYLIRRYKVHVYNVDELVLSALPYHDTHAFVRIIQLLDLQGKNKIWGFLEGVKSSGAPPPRKVIVQQCIRDMGVLEMICNYAIPTKKFLPSKEVVCFCTAVIVEVLGVVPSPDDGLVKRILPFVFDGLNPAQKAELSDSKAGSMMVVALLATRATLTPKLINNLIFFIARVAYQDATQSADLPWLRLCLMAIVSLVQSQTIQMFPKKGLDFLASIRDLSGVLAGLSKEFNIERFLRVYVEALAENSFDDSLCNALVSTIENVPMKNFVSIIIKKVLLSCLKLSQKTEKSSLHEAGKWARQILGAINKCYPDELRGAFRKFLEDPKVCPKQDSIFEVLCSMFDGSIDMPLEISYSKLWFHLEHPKAEVRRSALSTIAASGLLRSNVLGSQNRGNVQDAILQRLHDDDLSVVQASLALEDLCGIIKPPLLVHAFQDILMRCVDIQIDSPDSSRKACDVAISCLECAISNFRQHLGDYSKEIASMVFPLLLIIPKTWKLNIKALELVKEIAWPFYSSLSDTYNSVPTSCLKELKREHLASMNAKTVEALARGFLTNVEGYVPWLIECCKTHKLSKTLFFLIIQQSFILNQKEEAGHFLLLFQACFPMLRNEWHLMESQKDTHTKELKNEKIEATCKGLIDHLFDGKFSVLNLNILICLFWSILEGATSQITVQGTMVGNKDTLQIVDDLFVFLAMSSLKNVLLEQLQRLVMKNNVPPIEFLSKFFTEDGFSPVIQETSLSFLATSCSSATLSKSSGATTSIQLLLGFPTLLIPLASDNQDVRVASMNCIECLFNLSNHIGNSNLKNGNETLYLSAWIPAFGDLLGMIKEQRKLILSDAKFLSSYLTSVLSSFNQSLLVPQNADKWFDQQTKEAIVHFILSSALNLAAPGKLKLLSLFREMGNTILNVAEVKVFLSELLERRKRSHIDHDKSSLKLAAVEVEMLCLLLEICLDVRSSSSLEDSTVVYLFKALQVDGLSSEDPAVIKPCATVLLNLSARFYNDLTVKLQDDLFCQLLILFRTEHGVIQNATKDALLRVNVNCSSIIRLLDMILSLQHCQLASPDTRVKKKKSAKHQNSDLGLSLFSKELAKLPLLSSFLDVLLLKKDMESRPSLVEPLFRLLAKVFDDEWFSGVLDQNEQRSLDTVGYIQQTVLLILEEIVASLSSQLPVKAKMLDKFNVDLLVACARSAKDVTTRNHVFLLLSSVSKIIPDQVLDHILDIFTVVGEAAVTQSDGHSQHVFEELMSAVVPCWLSRTGKPEGLLQIFVNVLPEITEHRRLGLMVYLLRTLGEKQSLGLLFVLLLRSLVQRTTRLKANGEIYFLTSRSSAIFGEWEFLFAIQLCDQYSCITWLPSLVMLLQEIGGPENQEQVAESLVAMQFVQRKLQDTELVFKLESGQEKIVLEGVLGTLLEQVVYHYQTVTFKSKQLKVPSIVRRELKDCIQSTLRTITLSMGPSVFFEAITKLLDSLDDNVRKKALSLLCETLKNHIIGQRHYKTSRKPDRNPSSFRFSMDEAAWESFDRMCLRIIQLFAVSNLDSAVKLVGLSALEIVANQLPSNSSVYVTCLASVAKDILSDNLAVSSACLRTTAALISALGPKALLELPHIMGHVLERARRVSSVPAKKVKHGSDEALGEVSSHKESILVAILMTLDAIIEKLGGFLNPYLKDIVELMVLHLEHYSETYLKVKQRADAVRRLLIEKIPVRLILIPLLKVYPEALKQGEQSLVEVFRMLANAIGRMDRSSVRSYHAMIFDQCLMALDLRGQHQASIKDINIVEENVIHAMSVLTMKLTETMFRPLFVRTVEWTEAESERNGANSITNLDRNISFYKLINKLAEQQRSLFVPYFKYLLESCTRYLTDDEVPDFSQKRKKPKLQLSNYGTERTGTLSISQWQLRALVLSALNKCFLYDIGNIKFLDSTNFQVLLKPIVSQLIAEPPATLEQFPNIPSVKEVDDILVSCLCQMAVTAGTDVLWKPLNHEVLMQTRSEKIRSRILGLRVVKCLVERLKEEYLIFLAETIPFLAELLEDAELPVKSLAQEILKELETLSGENIKEYL